MPLGNNSGLVGMVRSVGILGNTLVKPPVALGFDPSVYGAVAGWYKADTLGLGNGATVASWTDSSSNNIPFTTDGGVAIFQTNQQNGLPTIYFDGTASLVRNGMGFNGFCVAVVFKRLVIVSGVILEADNNATTNYQTADAFLLGYGSGGGLGIAHNNAYTSGGSNLLITKYYSYIVNCDVSGNMTSYVNGVSDATLSTGSGTGTSVKLRLAYRADNASYFDCNMGEAVVYQTGLTAANIAALNNYLVNKWSIS